MSIKLPDTLAIRNKELNNKILVALGWEVEESRLNVGNYYDTWHVKYPIERDGKIVSIMTSVGTADLETLIPDHTSDLSEAFKLIEKLPYTIKHLSDEDGDYIQIDLGDFGVAKLENITAITYSDTSSTGLCEVICKAWLRYMGIKE